MSEASLNKHPAEFFLRYLLLKDPETTDAELQKTLDDWGILQPGPTYWGFLRQRVLDELPDNFDPANRLHRASMAYLRAQKVYEMFFPSPGVEEAWAVLADPSRRTVIEQALMAHLDFKTIALKLNRKHSWHLTEEGVSLFYHFFWNVKLLTFDEWGRFLYNRTVFYDRHMALLQAPPSLAFFHLRLDQALESKRMIQRAQEIAFHTLEEVNLRPGTPPDKVKAIGILSKVVIEAHEALSTSDMALKDVLHQFERFRMEHPPAAPLSIHTLAPNGNFSGSGADAKEDGAVVAQEIVHAIQE